MPSRLVRGLDLLCVSLATVRFDVFEMFQEKIDDHADKGEPWQTTISIMNIMRKLNTFLSRILANCSIDKRPVCNVGHNQSVWYVR